MADKATIVIALSDNEAMAIRRLISRNVKQAPKMDQRYLGELYEFLCSQTEGGNANAQLTDRSRGKVQAQGCDSTGDMFPV